MDPFVVLLVVISTVMHASWNLLARKQRAEVPFLLRMVFIVVLVGLLPAIVSEMITQSISWVAWACLFGSGASCALYYFALGRAYSSSDFTIVYPVVRALPVILVGLFDVMRQNPLTTAGWSGMSLVVFGCLLCPLYSFGQIRRNLYWNSVTPFILLAAVGSFGYAVFDKVASENVLPGAATAARYCLFFFFMTFLIYWPSEKFFSGPDRHAGNVGWILPIIAGVCNFGAYWLVLWAYQLTPQAGYVVAFRQFSIVIGVVVAFILYKESGIRVRLTGAMLITAGLIVIGLWGR